MTDRELLELAARAAGLTEYSEWADQIKDYDSPHYMSFALHRKGIGGQADSWNPLTDDGDALRLAVKLGIDIEWRADGRVAAYRHANADGHCFTAFESSREDRQENTRRAIVRAAAEIGKTLGE